MSAAHHKIESLIQSRVAMAVVPPGTDEDVSPGLRQCRVIDAVVGELLSKVDDQEALHQVHLMLVMDALFGPIP